MHVLLCFFLLLIVLPSLLYTYCCRRYSSLLAAIADALPLHLSTSCSSFLFSASQLLFLPRCCCRCVVVVVAVVGRCCDTAVPSTEVQLFVILPWRCRLGAFYGSHHWKSSCCCRCCRCRRCCCCCCYSNQLL